VTGRLALACARHPWRTVAAWIGAIVLALGLTAALLPGSLTSEGHVTNNPESLQGYMAEAAHLHRDTLTTELVVIRSETLRVTDPAYIARFRAIAAAAKPWVGLADVWYVTHHPGLVSSDRHALLVPLRLSGNDWDASARNLIDVVKQQNGKDGFEVAITGTKASDVAFTKVSQSDLEKGELRYGLPAAMIVLVFVFGALVAAGLPLLLAIVSILVALGLTSIVADAFQLSVFVVNMLVGMGLALGIDYALFVVSRVREERALGRAHEQAIGIAGSTASRSVLFSGSAFVLAMLGMLLVQSTIMRSLATGAILVGLVSVVAALTLLPAVLSLLGDRIEALRLPGFRRYASSADAGESRFFRAAVRLVTRRPALYLVLTVIPMLACISAVLSLHIGASGIATLPGSQEAKVGYLALLRSFPRAGANPAEVVVLGRADSAPVHSAIGSFERALASDGRFGPVSQTTSPDGQLTLLLVPVSADALSSEAIKAVKALRHTFVPQAFAASGAHVLVTGKTAENVDYFATMRFWLPWVFLFVLGLSFLLLTVAFRSIVVSATAIVLNLLSVGTAYGLLVLVFEKGYLHGVLGFTKVDEVEAWVPLFLFSVLFGLSMDYQVFLLSRIRERFAETGDNADAIEFGIASTARLITGAALIIVAVFAGFAAGQLVAFQQMGFGVAVALLIDATIVRTILVPATMTLLGQANWYLPRWLDWIPHVGIEAPAPAE
jgi:RND superfamily putative drug exporter